MNIYQKQHSETVFDRLWGCIFLFTALTDSQAWTSTSSEGDVSSCLCASYKGSGLQEKNKQGENVSNDSSRPADARDKMPLWRLAESVSDNCSITPVGQRVWESAFVKDVSLKKCFKLEVVYDECDCLAESGQKAVHCQCEMTLTFGFNV